MLAYDWKRALRPGVLSVGMALTIIFVFLNRMDILTEFFREGQMPEQGFTQKFAVDALTGEKMLFFLPVLCTVPYASSFADEWKSGMVKFAFCRISKSRYFLSKALTAAISGGIILTVGALGVMAASNIIFLPLEMSAVSETAVEVEGQSRVYLQVLVRYFCFGAMGAETGLWLSTSVDNRFMGWAGPFMAEYLLIILYERYFPWGTIFYPKEWLAPSEGWPLSGYGSSLWMLFLSAFAAWAFIRSAERKAAHV